MPSEKRSPVAQEKNNLFQGAPLGWIQWSVVTLAFILTVSFWAITKQQEAHKNEKIFSSAAEQAVLVIKQRLLVYENALIAGVAHIDSNGGTVNYDQWHTYANSLNLFHRYPGINGIGVIFNVQAEQMPSYLAKEKNRRPDYGVHPQRKGGEYWPSTYIEPLAPNRRAVGLDVAFEPNRYAAVKLARDTGKAQATAPIVLVQDEKKTPGFLLYVPFYKDGGKPDTIDARREMIVGATYAPFIVYKLVHEAMDQLKADIVDVKISDAGQTHYDAADYFPERNDAQPEFKTTVDVPLFGRTWRFDVQSNLNFRESTHDNKSWIVLAGGLVMNAFILALFLTLSKGRRDAVSYAHEVNKSLSLKTAKLLETNAELNNFTYVASHDFKSPLRGIDQLATWITEDMGDNLSPETRDHLRLMRTRISRMEKLLDDLLAYSRVGRNSDESIRVDTHELITNIFDLTAPEKPFQLVLADKLPKTLTQKAPLALVFRNLISNAIKHHDKAQGALWVSARPVSVNGVPGHEFEFKDDGPGIPPEQQERAFGMFQTLKPRDEVEGSGVGLAFVKKTVEHMGGSIQVESDGLHGCTFRFTWPKTPRAGNAA